MVCCTPSGYIIFSLRNLRPRINKTSNFTVIYSKTLLLFFKSKIILKMFCYWSASHYDTITQPHLLSCYIINFNDHISSYFLQDIVHLNHFLYPIVHVIHFLCHKEAVVRRYSVKKMLLEFLQNS